MKLTYWYCPHKTDSAAYNLRAKTRRELKALRKGQEGIYDLPRKSTIEWEGGYFGLLNHLWSEGCPNEEAYADGDME